MLCLWLHNGPDRFAASPVSIRRHFVDGTLCLNDPHYYTVASLELEQVCHDRRKRSPAALLHALHALHALARGVHAAFFLIRCIFVQSVRVGALAGEACQSRVFLSCPFPGLELLDSHRLDDAALAPANRGAAASPHTTATL